MIILAGILLITWVGCKKDPSFDTPASPVDTINFVVPQGWPQPIYSFTNNPLTQEGFQLGRRLFYETMLSRDNTISCASCHQQFAAFSHLDHPVSHGIDGLLGTRNAPALFNLAWHRAFMWDGGINHLESQPISPIQNRVEMDDKIADVVEELDADENYRSMFKAAFGSGEINSQRIFRALALFMGAMVSANSRYDNFIRNGQSSGLTDQELNGLKTFRSKCGSCHTEPLFSDFSYRNNGLKPDARFQDQGRALITQQADDIYKFKTPSLRNVALTAPYMHDGRFSSLNEVLDHYQGAKFVSPTLDIIFQSGFSLSDSEKTEIIAFLQTLSDNEFISDKRFSEP